MRVSRVSVIVINDRVEFWETTRGARKKDAQLENKGVRDDDSGLGLRH